MDTLDQLRAFTATAQAGSFTGGAGLLGISNRLTSKYVAELEARLGVRLFQRTTRRVGLTPAGEELLARAPALLDELDDMLSDLAEGSRGFTGPLRISAPVTFGEVWVAAMLGRFAEANPGLSIDLRLTDSFADLARDGIDLAIRIGRSEMLSLKTRRLGRFRTLAVASPAYIARHGQPQHPEALAGHACIVDTNRRLPRRWTFHDGARELPVAVEGRFAVNSASAAVALAEAGLGIANVPRFALCGAVEAGRLVPLFPTLAGEEGPVSAVYLEGRALPRKTRALIDFAADDLRRADLL